MRRDLLIAAGPGEWQAALLEDGAPVELYVERGDLRPAGSIHVGRVVRRAAGLDSVFVDIGDERAGLLPAREAAADGIVIDEGARIVVQVRREAQQGKGARLSARITGRPGLPQQAALLSPPAQLYPAPGLANTLAVRLPGPVDSIRIDERAAVPQVRAAFPGTEVDCAAAADWPIDLDGTIEAALASSLALPGGGTIHIEETRAGVLVDVDTGTPSESSAERGAMGTNRAASRALARELRLRNLGGGIVIDFVGLEGSVRRDRVRQALAAALASDPARPEILGWTRLGHLELVRPRRGRPLSEALLEPVPPGARRKQPLALAHEALRLLSREARLRPGAKWRLRASPPVTAALCGPAAPALRDLEQRLGRRVEIVDDPGVEGFDIAPV